MQLIWLIFKEVIEGSTYHSESCDAVGVAHV